MIPRVWESESTLPQAAWKVAQVPYSLWCWGAAFGVMGGLAAGSLGMLQFMPFRDFHRQFAAPGMAACIKLTGARVKAHYHPDLKPERPSVYLLNHVNVMDGHLASWVIPTPFCGLMLAWHFKIPAYGWMMRMSEGIAVYPRSEGRTGEITAQARDRVAKGLSILAFPEAHRTMDGRTREFRRGVFYMARDAGMPVVPMAARGMYDVKRKGSWKFTPGEIEVYVGRQYETEGLDDDGVRDLADEMHGIVDGWVEHRRTPMGEPRV